MIGFDLSCVTHVIVVKNNKYLKDIYDKMSRNVILLSLWKKKKKKKKISPFIASKMKYVSLQKNSYVGMGSTASLIKEFLIIWLN